MTQTPLRFVHVGFGNMICANEIDCVIVPTSACAKRLQKNAKDKNQFLDLTFGRATKSLLVMKNSKIISCALTGKTIAARINPSTGLDTGNEEGDEGFEDDLTECEAIDAE